MRSVIFKLRTTLTQEEQEHFLDAVRGEEGIHAVGPLFPNAKDPERQRQYYAYVKDQVDIETIVRFLSSRPEIESTSIQAPRYLT